MNWEALLEGLWSLSFLPIFLLCGGSVLLRCRLLPLRRLGLALRLPFRRERREGEGISSAQAASTALAATIGTGNIIGTAQALAMGGPGAVFWLWAAALLGAGIKYAEILLGLQKKQGAMGYLNDALGKRWAGFYAICAVCATILVGNMAQMNGAFESLRELLGIERPLPRLLSALALWTLVAFSLSGGARSVGRVTERLVPIMAGLYVAVLLLVLIKNRELLPQVFRRILEDAFCPRAPVGAAGGAAVRRTVVWGLRRGIFSNEAGLGTAANIHAEAEAGEAPLHALWGVFEVFADTVLLCSLTAFAILSGGADIPYGKLCGPEPLRDAVSAVIGNRAAGLLLTGELLLFSLSTVMGCAVSGGRCARWLGGRRGERRYRSAALLCAFLGCLLPVSWIWQAADAVNALLAVPNLLALLILAPEAGRLSRGFFGRSEKNRGIT